MRLISFRSLLKTLTAFAAVTVPLFARAASFEVASLADIENYAAASGGDEVRKIDNGDGTVDFIHIFSNTVGTAKFTVPVVNAIRSGSGKILVVGGGAGGSGDCGGGGAGGLIYKEGLTVGSGTITVGAGGAQSGNGATGNNGANTVLTLGSATYTAIGGGTSGRWGAYAGVDGGSGGGSSSGDTTVNMPGQALQPTSASGGFGNPGGRGGPNDMGGGGGGAGSAGVDATGDVAGDGGSGLAYDISGEVAFYAAGGGGAATHGRTLGKGGSGIGGDGLNNKGANPAGAGKAGTGSGGGGGGGGGSGTSIGGAGGSGVVIIRYTAKLVVKVPENVKDTVYSFKDAVSDTIFNLPKAVKADILLVGGGGAGANPGLMYDYGAGGGGAGGMIEALGVYLAAGMYDIIVGRGGVSPAAQGLGEDGESSKILLSGAIKHEALGGGGGGLASVGRDGGSGGGGSNTFKGGVGKNGQGNDGGDSSAEMYLEAGSGGGGAGSSGGKVTAHFVGGAGGLGKASSITGSEIVYAAGGGGGTRTGAASALGGSGIGGNGGYLGGSATNGRKNTGSGGGGGSLNTKGGNGGSGIVVIRIIDVLPEKPNAAYMVDYNGSVQKLYKGGNGVVITKDGAEVSEIAVKDVGTYNYVVTLKDGYKWADLTENKTVDVQVTVNAPAVTVNSVSVEPWQIGQTPKKPVVVTSPFQVKESDYVVKYSPKGANNWSEAAPTEAGEYDVTIEFKESLNFTVAGTIPVTSVVLWAWNDSDKYLDSLGYHSKITITATNETPLVNFPMLIKIKEGAPKGFEYKYANPDGSDIRFVDSDGNILAHEFDTWDPAGESIVWVKVPLYAKGMSITMCWGELVDKTAPAARDPKEVWAEYVGVWHMDDAEDAKNGGVGTFGTNTSEYNGPIGKARGNKSNSGGAILSATNRESIDAMNTLNGNTDPESGDERGSHSKTFTASFWVYLTGNSSANAMIISRKTSTSDQDRWGLSFRSANNYQNVRYFYKDDLSVDDSMSKAISKTTWHRMDIIFDDWYDHKDGDIGYSTIWIDGVRVDTCKTASTFAAPNDSPFRVGGLASSNPLFGRIDEMRVRQGTLPVAWMTADYLQVKNTLYSFEETKVTPGAYFKNRWLREPSVTKTLWFEGEDPAEADAGEPVYGEAYYTFTGVSASMTNAVPGELGTYEFLGQVDGLAPVEGGAFGYEMLHGHRIEVAIMTASPDSNLGGAGGNPTLAGRVLLANDWGMGAEAITGQDYSNTNSAKSSSYWVHEQLVALNIRFKYMSASTRSTLMSTNAIDELCGSKVIWQLDDVRIGNWYWEGCAFDATRNYLPWSEDALPNGAKSESSHLVVRNVQDAAIYSPCYTNGIGTIYFDAVNALAVAQDDAANDYRLVVEVCTNVLDGAVSGGDGTLEELPATEKIWKAIEVSALKRDGTAQFSAPETTDELALGIKNGGTAANFYRVYAKLNYAGPIQFRIRRSAIAGGNLAQSQIDPDTASILIDNIVVSYPAMRVDLDTYGEIDLTKGGKRTLGVEGAFEVSYPSVSDQLFGRARPKAFVSAANKDADISSFVISSKMLYRWRYLEQDMTEWQSVALNHKRDFADGFTAIAPLDLPRGMIGDVEYFFVSHLKAPYYEYVDYSGANLNLGGHYTENISVVTNRFDSPVILESRGTDWFVRLREGKSTYETINLIVAEKIEEYREDAVYKTNSIPMELVADGIWRGLYQTPNKDGNENGIEFRIEAMRRQDAGSLSSDILTTHWALQHSEMKMPVSDVVVPTGGDVWSRLPNDGATGYLLFQLDDATRAITIVHADYQNFNAWNDANKGRELFLGNSIEDDKKTGASPNGVSSKKSFANWSDLPKSNRDWQEAFSTSTGIDKPEYQEFTSALSPNGWNIANGMFVYGNYRDNTSKDASGTVNRALQLKGNGLGSIELVNPGHQLRGIGSISFNARLGQSVQLEDCAYFDSGSKTTMTNYTFVVAGAFDANKNNNFRGNASLSLFTYYIPEVGAYELRIEQISTAKSNNKEISPIAPAAQGQRISLHRWHYDATGRLNVNELAGKSNDSGANWPGSDGTNGFQAVYFSVSNTTQGVHLTAGFKKSNATGIPAKWSPGVTVADEYMGIEYCNISYTDTSDERMTSGTYGLLTANCEGMFGSPRYIPEPVALDGNSVTFSGIAEAPLCAKEMVEGGWVWPRGRMEYDDDIKGLRAVMPSQTLNILTAPAGTRSWSLLEARTISSFGSSGNRISDTINVFTNSDCSVRFEVGGDVGDVRTDVVIDDIELTHFRGAEWDDDDVYESGKSEWESARGANYTNFIFTTAWIENGAVKLSPRRTDKGGISSIRSPLYDDGNGRGVGLGMISFKYKNAHENVKLVLEVATDVFESDMSGIDNNAGLWTSVTNFTFTGLGKAELASGSRSCYIGLHGVRGVMRIRAEAANPALVKDMDESTFPEIYITEVFCRDEPALDPRAWWGWNLRTLGDDYDSEKRMYLYDYSQDLSSKGMSLALNNSVDADVDTDNGATYEQHQPFVQTPVFTTNLVGEISFKARKYTSERYSQPAQVTLYGSASGALNSTWVALDRFVVSNSTYTTYKYKTKPSDSYYAFRLGVTGVDGVESLNPQPEPPIGYDSPVRVLIDEVLVSEAIRAAFAFRNVGAFRNKLDTTGYVPNVPSMSEQPLIGESWGVQCEVFASQLEEEIDWDKGVTVKLHWFVGQRPWGYANWRSLPEAKSAELARATDTNLIFRSSYRSAPDAVIQPVFESSETVQYELEATYYTVGSDEPQTSYLSKAGSWVNPSWYKGVDKNRGKDVFCAYTILDSVAPGWAWINEANIYGGPEEGKSYGNREIDFQYVELAVPAEADLTGWRVRLLGTKGSNQIVTNTLAVFGSNSTDISPTKPNLIGMASNMVYRVIGNDLARKSGRLKFSDGTLDGVWSTAAVFGNPFAEGSESIKPSQPFGIQLVRPSGIVEHEVALLGNSPWEPGTLDYDQNHPSNFVEKINKLLPDARFFYVGTDDCTNEEVKVKGEGVSLSVMSSRGETEEDWFNNVKCTPGRINDGQIIDPDHPTPNGSSVLVYANLDHSVGHIYQTAGDSIDTPRNMILVIPKGSATGTNITYSVDRWYKFAGVTTNGTAAAWRESVRDGRSVYEAVVGVGASNNVTVVASAKLDDKLVTDYGLGPDNKYRDAVIDWLEKGVDLKGNTWENLDSGEIRLAEYQTLGGNFVTNLTLTQMYWLDIDPTAGNFIFRGGMCKAPQPNTRSVQIGGDINDPSGYLEEVTDFKMGVKLYITNKTDNAESRYWKKAWAPYVLRGAGKGETSQNYAASQTQWTNVTFKITGFLNNGLNRLDNKENWIPLRWFVFDENSFDDDFTTYIEIRDPFSTSSPGYSAGWHAWHYDSDPAKQDDGLFFSWSLDTRLRLFPVEALKQENYYDYQP